MNEILIWLNANQGVIGLLSLLVTIIGFFWVKNSIKTVNKQNQKGGVGSLNQQSQNSSVNQNIKQDTTNK